MDRPLTLMHVKVTKIEYAPLAFGAFPHGMFSFPLGILLTPKQKIEIIKKRLDPICLADNFSIEENSMLQPKGILFRVIFNNGTILVYNEDGSVTNEKEEENQENK